MTKKVSTQKQTLSTKVPKAIKTKIEKEAIEKGISTSEHLASILEKYEEQKERIDWLENELLEKNRQISRHQTSIEDIQISLTDAQKLQFQAESRNREISDKYTEVLEEQQLLLTEVETVKNKPFLQRLFNR